MAILLLVIGFCFIKGKYLRLLADFDPTEYTEKQVHLIGKVAGVYFMIEGLLFSLSAFLFFNDLGNFGLIVIGAFIIVAVVLIVHLNLIGRKT